MNDFDCVFRFSGVKRSNTGVRSRIEYAIFDLLHHVQNANSIALLPGGVGQELQHRRLKIVSRRVKLGDYLTFLFAVCCSDSSWINSFGAQQDVEFFFGKIPLK